MGSYAVREGIELDFNLIPSRKRNPNLKLLPMREWEYRCDEVLKLAKTPVAEYLGMAIFILQTSRTELGIGGEKSRASGPISWVVGGQRKDGRTDHIHVPSDGEVEELDETMVRRITIELERIYMIK